MPSLLTRLARRRCRPTSSTAPRRRRLEVETLEDRRVPTVVFIPKFGNETIAAGSTNDGMQHPPVYFIFSGSYWSTTAGKTAETLLSVGAKEIFSSPYLSGLKQYGSDGTASFAGSWNDSNTVPSNPSVGTLQGFLQSSITAHAPSPAFNFSDWQHAPIYVVVSDPASSQQFNGGWNAQGTYYNWLFGENIHMIWVGTSSQGPGVSTDSFTLTLSHELAETISDPDSSGIRVNPPSTLPPSLNGPNENQIGDYEPEPSGEPHYGYRLNGALVQPYWSNLDNAFIVPDGNSQRFFLYPIWNANNTFTGKYNLSVVGDQLGVNYNDNIRIDRANTSSNPNGVKVTENNQTATFDSGVIKQVNVDTKGGANFVQVASVASGVTVNIDSTGHSSDFVFVGTDNASLSGIQGTVNVSNSSGQTTLKVDAYADGPRNVTITNNAVAFAGLATIHYNGGTKWSDGSIHGVTSLGINDGAGKNYVDVASVPALTSVTLWADVQDLIYGPAANQITVQRTHA